MSKPGSLPRPRSLVLGPLEGHKGIIESVAFSPNNTLIASSSSDWTIRIWDALTGTPIGEPLRGHRGSVASVVFSPDSLRIASGSHDFTVRIWDVHTGVPIGEPLQGHAMEISSVAFSPDSIFIASGSYDWTIRIWDAQTGAPIGEPLQGHDGAVRSVAFSPDSSRIASGSEDEIICIWDAHTGTLIGKPLKGVKGEINSVAFSPNGNHIASGSTDCTVSVWDVRTRALIGEPLVGHDNLVRSVAFSSDGSRIVSGSDDCSIRIWDARTRTLIGEPLQGHNDTVSSVAFSPGGNLIISGSFDTTICVWDVSQTILSSDNETSAQGAVISSNGTDIVASKMSAQEMFECLVKHGCTDLSSVINPDRYSPDAITRGGFGGIWKGQLNNGLVVAIKCVWLHTALDGDPKDMKRASRETYIWSKTRHENVQELTGVILFRGSIGMVSPWMENGNLQNYLNTHPGVDPYPLSVQLAAGVAYLHGIDMVHGDLKATNVLVSPEGVLKISDFDYAIMLSATLRFSMTSKIGGGTLRWMAPELLQQDGDEPNTESILMRTKQTDIYALGMTMLEIVSGRVPYYELRNDMAIYRAVDKKNPPKRPKELAATDGQANQMWDLLLKCWNHDPAARPNAPFILSFLRALVL